MDKIIMQYFTHSNAIIMILKVIIIMILIIIIIMRSQVKLGIYFYPYPRAYKVKILSRNYSVTKAAVAYVPTCTSVSPSFDKCLSNVLNIVSEPSVTIGITLYFTVYFFFTLYFFFMGNVKSMNIYVMFFVSTTVISGQLLSIFS